jgi:hypothetical protein
LNIIFEASIDSLKGGHRPYRIDYKGQKKPPTLGHPGSVEEVSVMQFDSSCSNSDSDQRPSGYPLAYSDPGKPIGRVHGIKAKIKAEIA